MGLVITTILNHERQTKAMEFSSISPQLPRTRREVEMDEQKIREAAYRLWEEQGKPQGQDLEHWFTAEQSESHSSSQMTPGRERPDAPGGNSASGGKVKNKEGR
jgi:hypothetical protein